MLDTWSARLLSILRIGFVFLYIPAAGPGPWSLDAAMHRGRGFP